MDARTPWLDDLEVVDLDSAQLRALAHPTRNRILTSLRLEGPATSAGLADRLDSNTGQTSYHLRMLAEVGLIEEDADRGTARERWWRAAHRGHSWTDATTEEDTDDRQAADWLLRYYARGYAAWLDQWHDQRADWPVEWREAATQGDAFLVATPALLRELDHRLGALLEEFRTRGAELDPEGPEAEPVTVTWAMFPSRHIRA